MIDDTARTAPAPGTAFPAPDAPLARFGLFDAVAGLLWRVAAQRQLVVVLGDLHRADAGTLQLLGYLAGDLPRFGVLVLRAFRDDEAGAAGRPVPSLLGPLAERAVVLPLGSLDVKQTKQLLMSLEAPSVDDDTAAAVHRLTGGNPFFIQQVVRLGSLAESRGDSVSAVVERRLAFLSPTARGVLDIAAVAGNDVSASMLAAVIGVPLEQVLESLDLAGRAGVIEAVRGDAHRFAHDIFRDTIYGLLGS